MSDEQLAQLYFDEKIKVLQEMHAQIPKILRVVEWTWYTYENDGTVWACANGGPAGFVDNLLTDLAHHPFVSEDKSKAVENIRRLKTRNMCSSPGTLTGLSNDLGYENVFAGQLRGEVGKNDLVIGFSGSGNSKNVLHAFAVAKAAGAKTACISGRGGGKATEIADVNIIIPGSSKFPGQTGGNDNNFHIEDLQSAISHIIVGLIKKRVQQ